MTERKGEEEAFYALDPMTGKGRELFRISKGMGGADISPVGQHIAYTPEAPSHNQIDMVSINGVPERKITVKSMNNIVALDWAADGKGFYVGNFLPGGEGSELSYVDFDGASTELWRQTWGRGIWGVPSPDGKYLAILGSTMDSNVWLLEVPKQR
jgi:hypothetical protein